ncbi:unnamed protein product [Bursaphelenchus okinawaensis]|uniref:ATPase AAA-type core domain-containing protein n=1 Tax=Bursaphelenchus okinawaensis TaxID=465554 RepID=A0A811KTK7_9BILA|nr:unnamed protein product [Bursaphelenchus okinawaensis]CAG9112160.1 unnamed protein product [Bursaphelenchus okinawaensis]
MDDDAFNSLAYDDEFELEIAESEYDEEAERYLQEQRHSEAQKETRVIEDDLDDELVITGNPFEELQTDTVTEVVEKRKYDDENLPFGEHPLDWFMRSELDTVELKKKKKEKTEIKVAKLADRIQNARKVKTAKNFGSNTTENGAEACSYVTDVPSGEEKNYIKISDPDGIEEGYLKFEKMSIADWVNEKVRATIAKSINGLNRAEESTTFVPEPRPQPSQPSLVQQIQRNISQINSTLNATLNNSNVSNMNTSMNRTRFIEGVDLSKFGIDETQLLNTADDDDDFSQPELQSSSNTVVEPPQIVLPSKSMDGTLWTKKYEPRAFLELITEDVTNKMVLTWLKLWDRHVYNKRPKIEGLLNEFQMRQLEIEEEKPNLPKQKVLLLHGPSGSGKSVLAKVCASTCGYEPFVVNLSEMNSLAYLKSLICERGSNVSMDQFTKTKTTSTTVGKPICFIIEGVDGASNEFTRFLAAYATEKKKKMVRRPIILTCNNAFVNSLKPLRTASLVIKCTGLNRDRAVKRLTKICEDEGITLKRFAIVQLFEQCRKDIRLCLNNLQYLSSTSNDEKNISDESCSRVEEYSVFDAIDAVLTTNFHLDARGHIKSPKQRVEAIQQVLGRRDDVDRVFNAIFFNAPLVFKLKLFQRLKIGRSLISVDSIGRYALRTQNFTLLRYLITAAVQIHFTAAVPCPNRNTYNLNFMGFAEKQKENREILTSIEEHQKGMYRQNRTVLLLTTLPYLYSIINIPLQSQNPHMLSQQDKENIARVAAIMVDFGLGFTQKVEQAIQVLCLDPPIEQLVNLDYSNKQTPMKDILMRILNSEVRQRQIQQVTKSNKSSVQDKLNGNKEHRRSTGNQGSNVSPITDSAFTYSHGSSQAIRRIIKNMNFLNPELL